MDSVMRFMLGSIPSIENNAPRSKGHFRKEKNSFAGRIKIGSPGKPVFDLSFHASSVRSHRS